MNFNYQRADVHATPAYPSGVTYRPVIPIWIGVEGGPRIPQLGLLDTGSDDTKFPLHLAGQLGVPLDRNHLVPFRGVGGEAFGYFGKVSLELRQSPRSWRWATHVAFVPTPPAAGSDERSTGTLGHTGFFRYFHADFNYQRLRVRIRPNGLFVGLRS